MSLPRRTFSNVVCLGCAAWYIEGLICAACLAALRPAPDRWLDGGLRVCSAYLHEGPARHIVHLLKYQAIPAAGTLLARQLLPLVPPGATALVPVSRVITRRWRYGIDPALVLARLLGRLADLPVRHLLRPPWWSPPQAGRRRGSRHPPRFAVIGEPARGLVLIDDVLTTGRTLAAAHHALGGVPSHALTATAAPQ